MAYSKRFYDLIREGCRSSAAAVVPYVARMFTPESVVDVGCGEGWWLDEFHRWGAASTVGLDGDYVPDAARAPGLSEFHPVDLSRPRDVIPAVDARRFDLAVSLEVAEHLPEAAAASFVDVLCALSDRVLFSAAIPRQGGAGHVNERWPGYWADRFAERGYAVSGALRWEVWNDDQVEPWYRQNLLVASRLPVADHLFDFFHGPGSAPFPVVHPIYWRERVLGEKV